MQEILKFSDLHSLPAILDGLGPADILQELELPENDFPEIFGLSLATESVGSELAYLVNSTAGNPFHPHRVFPPESDKTDPAAKSQLSAAMHAFGLSEGTTDADIKSAVESAAWLGQRYNSVREMTPEGHLQPIPGDLIQLELISSLLRGVMRREDAADHMETISFIHNHLINTLRVNKPSMRNIIIQNILRNRKLLNTLLNGAHDRSTYCDLLRLKYSGDIEDTWNAFQRGRIS